MPMNDKFFNMLSGQGKSTPKVTNPIAKLPPGTNTGFFDTIGKPPPNPSVLPPSGNPPASGRKTDIKALQQQLRAQAAAGAGQGGMGWNFTNLWAALDGKRPQGAAPPPANNPPPNPSPDAPPNYNPNLGGFVNPPPTLPPVNQGGVGMYSYIDPSSYSSWLQSLQGVQQPMNEVNPYDIQRYLDPRYRGGM